MRPVSAPTLSALLHRKLVMTAASLESHLNLTPKSQPGHYQVQVKFDRLPQKIHHILYKSQ